MDEKRMGELNGSFTWLERELLINLSVDDETTLLLVQLVNHLDPADMPVGPSTEYPEIDIRQALDRLASQGLVAARIEHFEGGPMTVDGPGGVPEYAQGREQVFWWGLTETGRSVAADCLAARDSAPPKVQDLTGLECDLLLILCDGLETTLLLLESANDDGPDIVRVAPLPPEGYSESDVFGALERLADVGLVAFRIEHDEGRERVRGVPEYVLGRQQIFWWGLTEAGRSAAARCLEERHTGHST